MSESEQPGNVMAADAATSGEMPLVDASMPTAEIVETAELVETDGVANDGADSAGSPTHQRVMVERAEQVLVSGSMLVQIIEAALLVAPEPLTIERLQLLFGDDAPSRDALQAAINEVGERCLDMSYALVKVASGYRFQVRQHLAPWVGRLYAERPAKYSRALLETLALVAYRQPATRGDIEDVRGVAVSTGIMRTLLERGWIHVVGYREVPGRPALYGSTKAFLDYFSLASLEELPPLSELRDLDQVGRDLELALGLDTDLADSQLIDRGMSALDDEGTLLPSVTLSNATDVGDALPTAGDAQRPSDSE